MGCTSCKKEWKTGICDVCKLNDEDETPKKVYYCDLCKASICEAHDKAYISRGISFIKSLIKKLSMKAKSNEPDDRKFLLKPGTLLRLPGTSIDYNNANLTDQIARNILAKSPGSVKFFAKVDEDWQAPEMVTPSSFVKPVTVTQPTEIQGSQEQSKVVTDFKAFLANNLPADEAVQETEATDKGLMKFNTIIKVISTSESVEHITELVKNDTRAGVQKAAKKRIDFLNTSK